MPIQKANLILTLIDPGEVPPGVHQPHQKEPRFPPGALDVDEHLEEVDFGEVTGAIRQRHEHLTSLALPFRDRLFDQRDAHVVALGHEELVQARRGELLFSAGPLRGVRQERLKSWADRFPDRSTPRDGLRPTGNGSFEIFPHCTPRNP